jgi:hypothetical protein
MNRIKGLSLAVVWSMLFTLCTAQNVNQRTSKSAGRGSEFWKEIIRRDYNPPRGEPLPPLARELSSMLGSSDPDQRDDTAYAILANWVYEKRLLAPDDLRPLIAEWRSNLEFDIGSVGTDSTLRRSFSALMLAVVIARDNVTPFLTPDEFRVIFNDVLRYLNSEKDLRGYDPGKGWYHSAAHTADLLKFLGRSRHCGPAHQEAILDGIIQKMRSSTVVFSFGEDERFAHAVLSLVVRKDFNRDKFREWLSKAKPTPPASSRPEISTLRANQNVKNMLAKLEVLLISQGSDSPVQVKESAVAVQDTLNGTF